MSGSGDVLKNDISLRQNMPVPGAGDIPVSESIVTQEISRHLRTRQVGRVIRYFSTIDSTNLYGKQIAAEGAADGTLVIADEQTAGKGRSGRHWVTPPKEAISFTLILRTKLPPEKISRVTLVMGLAVAKAVYVLYRADKRSACNSLQGMKEENVLSEKNSDKALFGSDFGIKWPNDVVINGKKLCGILTEMSAAHDKVNDIVIGVGINANLSRFPEEIAATATSLKLELGREIDRARLIAAVMNEFEPLYAAFEETGSLAGMKDLYNNVCVNKDRPVRVLDPKGEYTGIARGIDESGALLVERGDGTIRKVSSGEVSVRGIYGYV